MNSKKTTNVIEFKPSYKAAEHDKSVLLKINKIRIIASTIEDGPIRVMLKSYCDEMSMDYLQRVFGD